MTPRQLSLEELSIVLGWAEAEGWNPGLEDAAAFYAADPGGFFVAEIEGAPVAAISVVNHSDDYAFLGLYICHPDFRGRGVGYSLWQHALANAGARTVGLDGVPEQQANYRKSGFELASQTTRLSGVLPRGEARGVRAVRRSDLADLFAMDRDATGVSRRAFVETWLTDTATRKTLVMDADDRPSGFVTVRQCVNGFKIGPLVAGSLSEARALMEGAAAITGASEVMIDLPQEMVALTEHCRKIGMQPCFSTARMYRGTPPAAGSSIMAVATLELG